MGWSDTVRVYWGRSGTVPGFDFYRLFAFEPATLVGGGDFDTSAVQQRVRIIRDLINTFRHRVHGVKVPITRAYMDLHIYDVVRYHAKPLDEPLEWMIYKKQINIAEETITLDLVQRARSLNWNGGNE